MDTTVGSHWDDVISRYKEVDSANFRRSDEVTALLSKIESIVKEHMQILHDDSSKFISPHLIDLAPDGYIGTADSG